MKFRLTPELPGQQRPHPVQQNLHLDRGFLILVHGKACEANRKKQGEKTNEITGLRIEEEGTNQRIL